MALFHGVEKPEVESVCAARWVSGEKKLSLLCCPLDHAYGRPSSLGCIQHALDVPQQFAGLCMGDFHRILLIHVE